MPTKRFEQILMVSALATLTTPASTAQAQAPDVPPPIEDSGPYGERVDQADPYEQADQSDGTPDEAGHAVDDEKPTLDEFRATLSPYGRWVTTSQYGLVWIPTMDDPLWRPYAHGEWVHTAYGWTFVSFDPWGRIPFHYGRWVFLRSRGWSWIPGYEWSPAWVSWRYGGDYVAWAPLGPSNFALGYYDSPSLWLALNVGYFGGPIYRRRFIPTSRHRTVFGATRFMGVQHHHSKSYGPPTDWVGRTPRRAVRRVRTERSTRSTTNVGARPAPAPDRNVKKKKKTVQREPERTRKAAPATRTRGRRAPNRK